MLRLVVSLAYAISASVVFGTRSIFHEIPYEGDDALEETTVTSFFHKSFHQCGIKNECNYVVKDKRTNEHSLYSKESDIPNDRKSLRIFKKHSVLWKSCQTMFNQGLRETKPYELVLPDQTPIMARCDMDTAGGGWIVFQRRMNADVSFNRGWLEYKEGFGDLNGNFWLGLDKLHMLAAPGKGAILRVEMSHREAPWTWRHATYSLFEISSEADGFRLKIGGYSGDAGDSLSFHNGMKFTTKDNDQDTDAGNCANACVGGWWFKGAPDGGCHQSLLNSLYPLSYQRNTYHMSWYTMYNQYGNVARSEMKLKYY